MLRLWFYRIGGDLKSGSYRVLPSKSVSVHFLWFLAQTYWNVCCNLSQNSLVQSRVQCITPDNFVKICGKKEDLFHRSTRASDVRVKNLLLSRKSEVLIADINSVKKAIAATTTSIDETMSIFLIADEPKSSRLGRGTFQKFQQMCCDRKHFVTATLSAWLSLQNWHSLYAPRKEILVSRHSACSV